MTGLPWARLDRDIWHHDKAIALEGRRDGAAAFRLYVYALAWSVGTATDGWVPAGILPLMRGTRAQAAALVDVGLWDTEPGGWTIRNYADRQQLSHVTDTYRETRSTIARRNVCARWMREGKPCSCGQHEPRVGPPIAGLRALAGEP